MVRIQERARHLIRDGEVHPNLRFVFDLPDLDDAGIKQLHDLIVAHRSQLVIIDVYGRVRPKKRGNEGEYAYDTKSVGALQKLAHKLGIQIILVHHLRKAGADDALDKISGSTGLAGAADVILTIDRMSDGTLRWEGRGRDIEDVSWEMSFEDGRWTVLTPTPKMNPEQKKLFEAMPEPPGEISPKDLAAITGLNHDQVRQSVKRMSERGMIKRVGHGRYAKLPSQCHFGEEAKDYQMDAM